MAGVTAAQALSLGADFAYLKKRSPPTAPTGYYDWQITTDPTDDREGHSIVTNLISKVESAKSQGVYVPNPRDVDAFLDTAVNPDGVDDRKGAFPTGLGIISRLDPNSRLAKKLNDSAVGLLYNTIPHPPEAFLGPDYCYRQADGGGNNLENPNSGRAGTAYARSVQGKTGLPHSSLPDPGLVFDSVLKRKGIVNHAAGFSTMIFAFASIVTHSLFRTDHKNIHINNASSYLDLSPLYGDNQAAQDKVRDKASGRGLLYPDTFSEERLLFLPPATSVLLVLFSRNHNYIAERLLKINERRLWSDPPPTDPVKRALQDEQIFQTARLVNGGQFMSTVMSDYVGGFLGASEGSNWTLDAFDIIDKKDLKVERGRGNHVSVEFNIMYRWHFTLAAPEQKWTEDIFNKAFDGKPFDQALKRGRDGKFSDDDLARILHTAIETPGGAYRGRGTPEVFRLVEIMGIEQSRSWGVCTMNEFRKFLGLKVFETFEDWNPDPEIANAARRLYGHVDNLELYTGLQAEATVPLSDRLRIACGYTTVRAVLGDAISLIRGDRFYTSDFTPNNLTTWGFHDCQLPVGGGQGGFLAKLIFRHLPLHFPWNSVYALYPFFTPEKMKDSLTKQGTTSKYSFDHPTPLPVPKVLNTFTGIKTVWNDPQRFKVAYEKVGYGSALVCDDPKQHDADRALILHGLFPDKDSLTRYAAWVSAAIKAKIEEKSWKYTNVTGNYVDIVKDVVNGVAAHWAADKLVRICFSPQRLLLIPSSRRAFRSKQRTILVGSSLKTSFSRCLPPCSRTLHVTSLAFDEPETNFALHEASAVAGIKIAALLARSISQVTPALSPTIIGKITSTATSLIWSPKNEPWFPFLSRLAATGRPIDELIGNIVAVAVGSSVTWAHAATNVIDFYLSDARAKQREHIIELVNGKGPDNDTLLRGYVSEAMRLKPQYNGLWRKAVVDAVVYQGPGLPPMDIKAGDWIWGSWRNAHLDPLEFPDPTTVNPRRPASVYSNLNGTGFHVCAGVPFTVITVAEILKIVFALKNVRRAPGNAGILRGYTEIRRETETDIFIQRNGTIGLWPGSLHLTRSIKAHARQSASYLWESQKVGRIDGFKHHRTWIMVSVVTLVHVDTRGKGEIQRTKHVKGLLRSPTQASIFLLPILFTVLVRELVVVLDDE
ncbi:hypothetical protein DXG01_006979 [Tephrocybe rancida]|nr:hypothetical protein DXG01_006979 [Tephrocybe rancida]